MKPMEGWSWILCSVEESLLRLIKLYLVLIGCEISYVAHKTSGFLKSISLSFFLPVKSKNILMSGYVNVSIDKLISPII